MNHRYMSWLGVDLVVAKQGPLKTYEQSGQCVGRLIRKLSTVKELKAEAKQRGFLGYSRLRKAQLIELLVA